MVTTHTLLMSLDQVLDLTLALMEVIHLSAVVLHMVITLTHLVQNLILILVEEILLLVASLLSLMVIIIHTLRLFLQDQVDQADQARRRQVRESTTITIMVMPLRQALTLNQQVDMEDMVAQAHQVEMAATEILVDPEAMVDKVEVQVEATVPVQAQANQAQAQADMVDHRDHMEMVLLLVPFPPITHKQAHIHLLSNLLMLVRESVSTLVLLVQV
jgi:hypothetical protein